jgi:hypothetical protein
LNDIGNGSIHKAVAFGSMATKPFILETV